MALSIEFVIDRGRERRRGLGLVDVLSGYRDYSEAIVICDKMLLYYLYLILSLLLLLPKILEFVG